MLLSAHQFAFTHMHSPLSHLVPMPTYDSRCTNWLTSVTVTPIEFRLKLSIRNISRIELLREVAKLISNYLWDCFSFYFVSRNLRHSGRDIAEKLRSNFETVKSGSNLALRGSSIWNTSYKGAFQLEGSKCLKLWDSELISISRLPHSVVKISPFWSQKIK